MNSLKSLRTVVIVAAMLPMLAGAQSWQIGIGASYRDFDDVDFKAIRNLPTSNLRLLLEAGEAKVFSPALIQGIQAGWVQIADVTDVAVGYRGMSEGVDTMDSLAPVISAETPVWAEGNLVLNFVTSLQWYNLDVSGGSAMNASATASESQYWVQNGVLAPQSMFPQRDGVPYGDLSLTGKARHKLEMDLYVIDVGLKLLRPVAHGLECFVAAGPTLNIVDIESSVRETVAWSAPGASGVLARQSRSDSDWDLILGAYVAAGGEYWFSEKYGVSLEARYDATLDKAETGNASVDLDGFSGQAAFLMRF